MFRGGVAWDVNLMFRSGVGCDVTVHVHVTLMMFRGGVGRDVNQTFMYMLRWWCYLDDFQGRGGMLTLIHFTIQRSWQPWANCFMDRSSFWKEKKGLAELDSQLQGELDIETLQPPGASQRRSQISSMGLWASILSGGPLRPKCCKLEDCPTKWILYQGLFIWATNTSANFGRSKLPICAG